MSAGGHAHAGAGAGAGGAPAPAAAWASAASPPAIEEAPDRLVFFFSGFDPKGAGFYHRLYREGAAARSSLGDVEMHVGPRRRLGELASACDVRWSPLPGVEAEADERTTAKATDGVAPVRTRHHFMRWDDIVRRHWDRSAVQLARDYLAVYGIGLPEGIFHRIWRKSRAAWGMAIFPLAVALASIGASFPFFYVAARHRDAVGPVAGTALALLGAGMVWRWVVRRLDCEWLLRLYAFTRAQAVGSMPALEARMDAMAAWIVQAVAERQAMAAAGAPPLRELLLVGYSTGSVVAGSVLARALPGLQALQVPEVDGREGMAAPAPFALSMLTLGHCVPVATDWRAAGRVRDEMRRLGDCDALTWHDWSAPADWAAFWRTPPWPEGSRLQGLQRSPRFHLQVSPAAYAALKRDRRQMHLQYLRPPEFAVEAPGYDWFRLTAGPQPLAGEAADR